MLIELAVADAFGIAFEFVSDPKKHGLVANAMRYQQNPRYPELLPSQYTDDTLRSIATAQVVLSGDPFDPLSYIRTIQENYRRDNRKGWSKRFQSYLDEMVDATPEAFLKGIKKRAASNGSIMGCLPLAYLPDPVSIRTAAVAQAITTHSVETAPYAQAMALAAHYFLYDLGSRDDLYSYLREECEGDPLKNLTVENHMNIGLDPKSMSAEYTATVVLDCVRRHNALTDILVDVCENIGGDTDSIAALAVGIASCSSDFQPDLPMEMIADIDNGGEFGFHYLRDLDYRLDGIIRK